MTDKLWVKDVNYVWQGSREALPRSGHDLPIH